MIEVSLKLRLVFFGSSPGFDNGNEGGNPYNNDISNADLGSRARGAHKFAILTGEYPSGLG